MRLISTVKRSRLLLSCKLVREKPVSEGENSIRVLKFYENKFMKIPSLSSPHWDHQAPCVPSPAPEPCFLPSKGANEEAFGQYLVTRCVLAGLHKKFFFLIFINHHLIPHKNLDSLVPFEKQEAMPMPS